MPYDNPRNSSIGKAGAKAMDELGKISSSLRRKRFDRLQDAGRPGSELTPGAGLMKTTDIAQFQTTPASDNPKESLREHSAHGSLGDHLVGLPSSSNAGGRTPVQTGVINPTERPEQNATLTRAAAPSNAVKQVRAHAELSQGEADKSRSGVPLAEYHHELTQEEEDKLRAIYSNLR